MRTSATQSDPPADRISLRDACALLPSPRGGKKTHINTMRRHCLSGRLRYWRQGAWMYVSRADVLALLVEAPPPGPRVGRAHQRLREDQHAEVLKKMGLYRERPVVAGEGSGDGK